MRAVTISQFKLSVRLVGAPTAAQSSSSPTPGEKKEGHSTLQQNVPNVGATGFEPATSCTPSKRASLAAPRPELGRERGPRPGNEYRRSRCEIQLRRLSVVGCQWGGKTEAKGLLATDN